MTWNDRRKGWLGRKPKPLDVPIESSRIPIPSIPAFSPAAVAQILDVYRSTVQFWIHAGKLESFRDNIGETYVLRDELVRFVREYLKK